MWKRHLLKNNHLPNAVDRRPPRQPGHRVLRVESLESRVLLSINQPTLDAGTGELRFIGSSDADRVKVSEASPTSISFNVESGSEELLVNFPKSQVRSIVILVYAGNDFVQNSTDIPAEIWGGSGIDTLIGGGGDDELRGNDDADILFGLGGNDILRSGSGNDVVLGGAGADTLYGEGGDDRLDGDDGNDVLYGGAGNDKLSGGRGNDALDGGGDDDKLYGDADKDTLIGNSGDDKLFGGSGDDSLAGWAGNDQLHGGSGNDELDGGGHNDQLYGDGGRDLLIGNWGNDFLYGGDDDDNLRGGLGDDQLDGGGHHDKLYGEAGRDVLIGNWGDDLLDGGDDDDNLRGGLGDDQLDGGDHNDQLYGDDGRDVLIGNWGDDVLMGGSGDDTLAGWAGYDELHGGSGNDELDGGGNNDQLYGDDGTDVLIGNWGDDLLSGGSGDDTLAGWAGNDTLYGGLGNDQLDGGGHDDQLYGDDGMDVLIGNWGDDLLSGGPGDDDLAGEAGNDELHGGSGNDQLGGGGDDDLLYGDAGADVLKGNWGLDFLAGGVGNDILEGGSDDDFLYGGGGDDFLFGDNGSDHLYGEDGKDYLDGVDGDDFIYGGLGNDELLGGVGNDWMFGDAGEDLIDGQADDDRIFGGAGSDEIDGSTGDDALLGGPEDDEILGGDGNDILFGGDGIDDLWGLGGEDLIVGGRSAYDEDPVAIEALMATWGSNETYENRVQLIENASHRAFLKSGQTVFDDGVPETLRGNNGRDWYIVTGASPIYDPLGNYAHHGHSSLDHGHGSIVVSETLPAFEGFSLIDSLDDVSGLEPAEALHTLIPHATNEVNRNEMLALFELVKYSDLTHVAIASGDWSDRGTWFGGQAPSSDARVLIPLGVEVVVDQKISEEVKTVRVDGTLAFATDADSELRAETIVVSNAGTFNMGTAAAPVADGVTARLVFTDNGLIDRTEDPFGISRGLITHGSAEIYGDATTPYAEVVGTLSPGATHITLAANPVGWAVGDEIVVAGTTERARQDELRVIEAIQGNVVTVAPLSYAHGAPSTEAAFHVANLSRNVVLESETDDVARRGHVMFMHSHNVDVRYASFERLGRTDKRVPLIDAVVDDQWQLVSGTGTNQRARYAVHFHRTGIVDNGNPAIVAGSVASETIGWAFVNHSSFVNMSDNVAYDTTGAAFVSEVGDEIGRFENNLAIATLGSGETPNSRETIQDFGHTGDGFWFQGGGVRAIGNIASGAEGSGFIYYMRGVRENGQLRNFLSENLNDPSIAGGKPTIRVSEMPLQEFRENVAYASTQGLSVRYHMEFAQHNVPGVVDDSTFWNNRFGVDLSYSNQVVLQDLVILHDSEVLGARGVRTNGSARNFEYNNLTVVGYMRGVDAAMRGHTAINGGTFKNQLNIVVTSGNGDSRTVEINGPISFDSVHELALQPSEVFLEFDVLPAFYEVERFFFSDTVTLNYGNYANQQVYFLEQSPTAIPFPTAEFYVPAQYVGLTSQMLYDLYGVAVGGGLAPGSTTTDPSIHGLIGP